MALSALDVGNYLKPISEDEPTGDDPRYLEEFEQLKTEVEKLSGCDFDLIENRARYLLLEKAKDLRVAGYLLLARAYKSGIQGLIEGLSVYEGLVEAFGSTLHPRRTNAQLAAIKWLNHPRLESFVANCTLADEEQHQALYGQIATLNERLCQQFGENTPLFTLLNPWLTKQKSKLAAMPQKATSFLSKVLPAKGSPAEASVSEIEIEDQKSFDTLSRKMLRYCKQHQLLLTQLLLARTLRWGNFSLPTSQKGRTLFPAPRKEARQELDICINGTDKERLLQCSETLFMEAGGQVWLDLQYHTYHALKALNRAYEAKLLLGVITVFIQQFPTLVELAYSDGHPFAEVKTQQWLQLVLAENTSSKPRRTGKQSDNGIRDHQFFLTQAAQLAKENTIAAQLACLQTLPTYTPLERLQLQYATAQLVAKQKPQIALGLLQTLTEVLKSQHLDVWLPSLAIDILLTYRMILLQTRASESQLGEIQQWLGRLDPLLALEL